MNKIEYHSLDKSDWAKGPWQDEPDKVQWYDETTDLPCLIVRGPHGALCGYVGVRPGHPWHGQHYDDVGLTGAKPDTYDPDWYPDAHGGLTFAGPCQPHEKPEEGICHIPREGDTDDIWWLGFDCAHAGDKSGMAWEVHYPDELKADLAAIKARYPGVRDDVYRDIAYVTAEVTKLAAQAARVGDG